MVAQDLVGRGVRAERPAHRDDRMLRCSHPMRAAAENFIRVFFLGHPVGKILIGETERFSQLEDDHEGAQVRRRIFLASGSAFHFQVNDCPPTRDQDYGYFYENGVPTPACGSVSLPIDRCYR